MIAKVAGVAAFVLLLTGCSQQKQPDEQQANISTAAPAGESDAGRVANMPESARNAVFGRALQDAELDCQNVKHSAAAGTYQGMPVWTVTCRDSGPWTIVISKTGVAQILNANEVKLIEDGINGSAPSAAP